MVGAYFTVYPVKPRGYNNLHVWPLYIVYIYTERKEAKRLIDDEVAISTRFEFILHCRVLARRDVIIKDVDENGDFIYSL